MTPAPIPVVVLGAGPAGLGAAHRLARRGGFDVCVIERRSTVGGNAGSFELEGIPVDYGSHRLHPSCRAEILADIRAMIGAELLDRPRHGRILLRGRWVHFPLQPADLALHLPAPFLLGALRDAAVKPFQKRSADSFASVLEHGLGRTICRDFYFPYAQKIWGVPPEELDVEQARRRVSAGSLARMTRKVLSAVPGLGPKGSGRFYYPKRGFGSISDGYRRAAEQAGARVLLGASVQALEVERGCVRSVIAKGEQGSLHLPARQVLSTIPLTVLARVTTPAAPPVVLESAAALRYRAMILIYLVLETGRFTEFDAHYFPGPDIPITRLSEPKNYGLADAPGVTVLCAELPCSPKDSVWAASEEELGSLAEQSLERAGLPLSARIRSVVARRVEQAYPIYTRGFREHFDRIDHWAATIDGLLTFGRQGLFAHDNTHHTLAMAYAACDSIDAGGTLDRARWAAHRQEFLDHVVED